jgi:hypothetical protein
MHSAQVKGDKIAQPASSPGQRSGMARSFPAVPVPQLTAQTKPAEIAPLQTSSQPYQLAKTKWGKKMTLREFHQWVDNQKSENAEVSSGGIPKDEFARFATPQGPQGPSNVNDDMDSDDERSIRDWMAQMKASRPGGLGISVPVPGTPETSPQGSPRNMESDQEEV